MQQPVGGHGAAAVRPRGAVEAGKHPACLPHHDVECAKVPQRHLGLGSDVDGTFGEQAVRQEVAIGAYPPDGVGELDEAVALTQLAQPERLENDRLADSRSATEDTDTRRGDWPAKDAKVPSPAPAHQRRCSPGALTTPTTGTPSRNRAIRVAHTGTPRTKFLVPSIGSITHCRPAKAVVPPNSSPSTGSSGRRCASVSRSAVSTERSASVTGVRSGLVSTLRSCAPNRARVSVSAWSASVRASARSSGPTSWQQSYHGFSRRLGLPGVGIRFVGPADSGSWRFLQHASSRAARGAPWRAAPCG